MTPQKRFFTARGNDELWVHDNILDTQGDAPQCEFLRAFGVQASENIGQAPGTVHGKIGALDPDGGGNYWRRFSYGSLLLAVVGTLLVHVAVFGAVRMWFLPWWATTGPGLLSLELSGAPGGGDGEGGGGPAGSESAGSGSGEGMGSFVHHMPDLPPQGGREAVSEASRPDPAALQSPPELPEAQPDNPSVQPEAEPPRPEPEPEVSEPASVLTPIPAKKPPRPSEVVATRKRVLTDALAAKPRKADSASESSPDASPTGSGEHAAAVTGRLAESGAGPAAGDEVDGKEGVSGREEAPGGGAASGEGSGLGRGQGDGHGTGSGLSGTGDGRGSGGGGLISFGSPGGPEVARMVMPEYPREARRLGKEGTVVLKISLDAAGEVTAVEVLETPGYGLDESAREAVLRSRFRPARVGGVPVACQAILPVHFRLR